MTDAATGADSGAGDAGPVGSVGPVGGAPVGGGSQGTRDRHLSSPTSHSPVSPPSAVREASPVSPPDPLREPAAAAPHTPPVRSGRSAPKRAVPVIAPGAAAVRDAGSSKAADTRAVIAADSAAARAGGRLVLLDFGALWCGNCVANERLLHTASVQSALPARHACLST